MALLARRHPQGPLRSAALIKFDTVLFWDKTRPVPIKPRDDDEDYLIKSADRTDFLSSRFFGTSRAGHHIMLRNETEDEPMRLCHHCGKDVPNPKIDTGCAEWCTFADECLNARLRPADQSAKPR